MAGRGRVSRPPAVRTKDSKKIKRGYGGLAEGACAEGTQTNDSEASAQRDAESVSGVAGKEEGRLQRAVCAAVCGGRRSLRRILQEAVT